MAETFDHFKHAWDRRTGKKLPYKVPESHFTVFADTLSPTPVQKRQDRGPQHTHPQCRLSR